MLRVSEVYLSTQGEGPNVGTRTCFTRFGGCNLRCPGWPCDTPFAIDPAFRKEWSKHTVEELANRIVQITDGDRLVGICYTGGEPMLQQNSSLIQLVRHMNGIGYHNQEMFSNGTILYPPEIKSRVQVCMDWKLPGSGEDPYNPVRLENLDRLTEKDSIKFVCSDKDDFHLAIDLFEKYILGTIDVQVYYGVAWGKLDPAELVKWVLDTQLPWKLNYQIHNVIWNPQERGR